MHRNSAFNAVLDVFWFDEEHKPASEQFLAGWIDYMAPAWNGEIYQNYPQVHQPGYGEAYWGDAQAGLYAVKCKYDPTHAFRFAQEVAAPVSCDGAGPIVPLPHWLQAALERPIVYEGGPGYRAVLRAS